MADTIRLLISHDGNPSAKDIVIDGHPWHIVDGRPLTDKEQEFICVSYAWGPNTVVNDIYGGQNLMSTRTVSVLHTAVSTLHDRNMAIWIDAYCLPPRGDPSRTLAIDRMGDIYAAASQVVVVLSNDCADLLMLAKTGIKGQANMDHTPPLEKFEHDMWVTRAWTYQEIVNSKRWLFVAEGHPERTAIDGMKLLDALGNIKLAYRRQHIDNHGRSRTPENEITVRLRFPNVDLFEDLLVDCILGSYRERSALMTMSNVERRIRERGEDYFNSMIGAISSSVESNSIRTNWKNIMESPEVKALAITHTTPQTEPTFDQSVLEAIIRPIKIAFAADKFMQLCETNGDYSFIFTSADRSDRPGQHWRPVPEILKPICSWHSHGVRQPGVVLNGRLCLQNMLPMIEGSLKEGSGRFLSSWVRNWYPDEPTPPSVANILQCLSIVGFNTTCSQSDVIELELGCFIPQIKCAKGGENSQKEVFVSSSIGWVFGAPGLLVSKSDQIKDTHVFHGVGIFVGDIKAHTAPEAIELVIGGV